MDRTLVILRAVAAWLNARRKAIGAFFLPGIVLLAPTMLDGGLPTAAEWRVAAATCVVTAFGVERIRNRRGAHVAGDTKPGN